MKKNSEMENKQGDRYNKNVTLMRYNTFEQF